MWHPESDSWCEVFTEAEAETAMLHHGCEDVTGRPDHEQAFKDQP